jgi:hypothetical protein
MEACKGRRIIFMQNDGNAGDGLIRFGAKLFLKHLGLEHREFDMGSPTQKVLSLATGAFDRPLGRNIFVYSGSGAWGRGYDVAYRTVHRQSLVNKDIFVLPTTLEFALQLNFPIYARDRFESLKYASDGKFCHDMAFYLALLDTDVLLPNRSPVRKQAGLVLRTDIEARGHRFAQHPQNWDIPARRNHLTDPSAFLRDIDQFEHIVTDRLHVAIGALLLKKRVSLAPGNYFKIKAIFESSIEGNFENVEFLESDEELADLIASTFD